MCLLEHDLRAQQYLWHSVSEQLAAPSWRKSVGRERGYHARTSRSSSKMYTRLGLCSLVVFCHGPDSRGDGGEGGGDDGAGCSTAAVAAALNNRVKNSWRRPSAALLCPGALGQRRENGCIVMLHSVQCRLSVLLTVTHHRPATPPASRGFRVRARARACCMAMGNACAQLSARSAQDANVAFWSKCTVH